MTTYLSKIATRFDGSGVNATTENQSGTQALMPSRITFDSNNAVDIGFPPSTFHNEFTFLESLDSSDNESIAHDGKMLKPSPNYIASSPVEIVRSLFYSEDIIENIDQESIEQSDLIVPQKMVNSKSHSQLQQADENNNLKPNKGGHVDENTSEHSGKFSRNDPQTGQKDQDFFSSTTFKKKQLKDKKQQAITPNKKKQKEHLSLEIKTASKEKNLRELQANPSFDTIGQNEMIKGQNEIIKGQPIINQLKPSIKKQRPINPAPQKKHPENKIRIGSIRVEILPAKPKKIKTPTQQVPQQKIVSPSKSSVNQTRFPLRFGLKQM